MLSQRQVKPLASKINDVLEKRPAQIILLLLFGLFFSICYWNHPMLPGAKIGHPLGWWEWMDQSLYLKSANALGHLDFSPDQHHYPLGYPALGALFVRWMPENPFFFPNLLLAIGSAAALWSVARRFLSPMSSLVFFFVFIALHAPLLARTNIIPWSTLPTQCALLAAIALMLQSPAPRNVIAMSFAAALAYLTRPGDCIAFAPLLVVSVLRLSSWRSRIITGLFGILILAGAVAGTMGINVVIYGDSHSPYEALSLKEIGFGSFPLSEKLFMLFIDPSVFFLEKTPGLFLRYPWLFFVLPGAIYCFRKDRWSASAILLSIVCSWGFYVSYNDFLPSDIFRYNLIHYLTWSFPVLALFIFIAAVRGWRLRSVQVGFGVSVFLLLALAGLQLRETALTTATPKIDSWVIPDHRSLVVEFPDLPLNSTASVALDGHPVREYLHYVKPETATHLKLWLGPKATGTLLHIGAPSAPPELKVFKWGWALDDKRLHAFLR